MAKITVIFKAGVKMHNPDVIVIKGLVSAKEVKDHSAPYGGDIYDISFEGEMTEGLRQQLESHSTVANVVVL